MKGFYITMNVNCFNRIYNINHSKNFKQYVKIIHNKKIRHTYDIHINIIKKNNNKNLLKNYWQHLGTFFKYINIESKT